jgi:hypothetical protein
MADSQFAGSGVLLEQMGEAFIDFALLLAEHELAPIEDSQSRAIVASVFKPAQAFHQDRRGRL